MKMARILEEEPGDFTLEYDNRLGKKNTMRLDAITYEKALREAKSFLGINEDNRDDNNVQWDIE
jgi:hypothetical protein